jgi:hypothetical protein
MSSLIDRLLRLLELFDFSCQRHDSRLFGRLSERYHLCEGY